MNIDKEALFKDMTKIKDNFYASSGKNVFQKNVQKEKIAETINSNFCLDDLMVNTVYLIPNTNCIFIDYLIFKMYAIPTNYESIVNRLIEIMIRTINQYGSFQMHINLSSFTITALERFQDIFKLYYDSCIRRGLLYDPDIIDQIVIYNTPLIMSSISSMIIKFTEPSVRKKMVLHKKDVSEKLLCDLLE